MKNIFLLAFVFLTRLAIAQPNRGFPEYNNCIKTMDVKGFKGFSGYQGVFNAQNSPSTLYLYLVAATIRDDGESTANIYSPTGDIGLRIYGGQNYESVLNKVRLFGPYDEGKDDDGSLKHEWMNYCTMHYNNFALMDVSSYGYQKIKIIAEEGDDGFKKLGIKNAPDDDVVFEAYIDLNEIKAGNNIVTGHCDIPSKCATFWFVIQGYQANVNCGHFWDDLLNKVPALPSSAKKNDYNPEKWGKQAWEFSEWFVSKVVYNNIKKKLGFGIWPHKWVTIQYADGFCIFNRVRAKRTMQDIINTAIGKGGDCDWWPWPEGSKHVCLDNYANAAKVVKKHGKIKDIVWIDHPTSNCGY